MSASMAASPPGRSATRRSLKPVDAIRGGHVSSKCSSAAESERKSAAATSTIEPAGRGASIMGSSCCIKKRLLAPSIVKRTAPALVCSTPSCAASSPRSCSRPRQAIVACPHSSTSAVGVKYRSESSQPSGERRSEVMNTVSENPTSAATASRCGSLSGSFSCGSTTPASLPPPPSHAKPTACCTTTIASKHRDDKSFKPGARAWHALSLREGKGVRTFFLQLLTCIRFHSCTGTQSRSVLSPLPRLIFSNPYSH